MLLWCGLLFFYGLSAGTFYRTEALRAIIGAETLSGRWLVPTLYGEPFLTKPPGQYVAIALASLPFGGVTEVSARLPSAIAATLVVLCFYGTLRRVVDRRSALISATMLPVSFLWLDKAPSAEIDMLQLGWVALALFAFLRADEANDRSRWVWWMLAMLAVTAGFLTKWTAPAFFYLTVGAYALGRKRLWVMWAWPHLVGVGVAVCLVSMWACAVAQETGWPLLVDTVMREASQRFAGGSKPYPLGEALIYPFAVFGANLPMSAFALLALRPSFFRLWDERGRRLLIVFHCWTWPNLFFWMAASQHNVRYSLPLAPGFAGLGIMVLIAWMQGKLTLPFVRVRPTVLLGAILSSWLIAKIVLVEAVIPARTAERRARETAAELQGLVPTGEILYLCKLKDEGIMFYYRRPVRKWKDAVDAHYVLLLESEWHKREPVARFEEIAWLRDQQGAPMVLVRLNHEP